MKKELVDMVGFMLKAEQEVKSTPEIPEDSILELRCNLIFEEFQEFVEACGFEFRPLKDCRSGRGATAQNYDSYYIKQKPGDLEQYADAIADLLYVVIGAAVAAGINIAPIYQMVHESNMKKFGEGGYKREDGKWIKPPDWMPPDIGMELIHQIRGKRSLESLILAESRRYETPKSRC